MNKNQTLAVALCALICLLAGCAAPGSFEPSYNHYFPKDSKYLEGDLRRFYDGFLFAPRPAEASARKGAVDFYDAFQGDAGAAHRFLHSKDRGEAGEYGEAWYYDCFLLLLRLGDDRFAAILQTEDQQTRDFAGGAVENFLQPAYHDYPKTRSFYKYRSPRHPNAKN